MDYDADGRDDIVTGSYTGQFYLFRGQPDGGFAQRELLQDETGVTLMMPFDEVYSVVPELVDMDADGDLDLVVGARTSAVQIVTNIGTRAVPKWSKARRELTTVQGKAIEGSNAHHADWDGDGVRDLIVGSESGEVLWYRNVGKSDSPRYDAGSVLITEDDRGDEPEGATPTRPGQRVKVHVTDWNGDGLADLLVGDVAWQESAGAPLTVAEAAEKATLEEQYRSLQRRAERLQGEELDRIQGEFVALRKQLRQYERTEYHTHGWVWLYLRQRRVEKR